MGAIWARLSRKKGKMKKIISVILAGILALTSLIVAPVKAAGTNVTVDFETMTNLGSGVSCNPTALPTVCPGIEITGTPSGFIFFDQIFGPLATTGIVLGFASPNFNDPNPGLDGNGSEVLTVKFLNNAASIVTFNLTAYPSASPGIENVPATVVLEAFDVSNAPLGSQTVTFTGVTNGQYTPSSITFTTASMVVKSVTLRVTASPANGIFVESLIYDTPLTGTEKTLTVTKTGNGVGTVTSNPAGINCGASCSALFANNAVVALTASPDADSVFTGWSGACTSTGACSVTMSASKSVSAAFAARISTVFQLNQFVAFSHDNTWIRQNSKINSGNVGANVAAVKKGKGANDRDNDDSKPDRLVEVVIGEHVSAVNPATVVVGDTVRLRNKSTVANVVSNELINKKGTILVTSQGPVDVPVLALPALPAITPGTQNVEVARRGSQTINPGQYGVLTVNADATLTLAGGTYHVKSLDVRQRGKILAAGPVEIYVQNEIDTDANSVIGPASSSVAARSIKIFVAGANDKGRRNDDAEVGAVAVEFGQNSAVSANVYAPNGTIHLRAGSDGTGAFIGKAVIVGERTKLTLDSAF